VSDLRTDLERVIAQVNSAEQKQSEHAATIDKLVPAATVRFVVTRWVLGSFLGYTIVVGLFIMTKGANEQTAQLIDIMKTLLLPLVTLVIGFYFGSKEAA
jgi:hypothetical protein